MSFFQGETLKESILSGYSSLCPLVFLGITTLILNHPWKNVLAWWKRSCSVLHFGTVNTRIFFLICIKATHVSSSVDIINVSLLQSSLNAFQMLDTSTSPGPVCSYLMISGWKHRGKGMLEKGEELSYRLFEDYNKILHIYNIFSYCPPSGIQYSS